LWWNQSFGVAETNFFQHILRQVARLEKLPQIAAASVTTEEQAIGKAQDESATVDRIACNGGAPGIGGKVALALISRQKPGACPRKLCPGSAQVASRFSTVPPGHWF